MIRTIPKIWSIWAIAGVAAWGSLGCQAKPRIPDDPLFVMRKPIEATPETAAPERIAFSEPAMPLDPIGLARAKQTRPVPGILTSNPAPAQPTSPD